MTADDISAWRARSGLTKKAAASAIGVQERTYRNYENGSTRIPRYVALACAAISFGLPPMGGERATLPDRR